jgi:hypothetical protein
MPGHWAHPGTAPEVDKHTSQQARQVPPRADAALGHLPEKSIAPHRGASSGRDSLEATCHARVGPP